MRTGLGFFESARKKQLAVAQEISGQKATPPEAKLIVRANK